MRLSADDEHKALLLTVFAMVAALYDDLEKAGAFRGFVRPAGDQLM